MATVQLKLTDGQWPGPWHNLDNDPQRAAGMRPWVVVDGGEAYLQYVDGRWHPAGWWAQPFEL